MTARSLDPRLACGSPMRRRHGCLARVASARRSPAALVAPWLLALAMVPHLAAQQPATPEAQLGRAVAALDSAQTERGIELLRRLLAAAPSDLPEAVRVRAHLHLGAASLSLGLVDSASAHLREMVRLNPFALPDPLVFNPDLQDAYRRARRSTPVVALKVAADTVLDPAGGRYLVAVAVGAPGQVALRLSRSGEGAGRPAAQTDIQVDSTSSVALSFLGRDSLPLEPGEYRLSGSLTSQPEVAAVATLIVSRQPVDTASAEPPLAPTLFRPEMRKGGPAASSALLGLVFGAAAAALPTVLAHQDLRSEKIEISAVSVGAGISLAGIVGVFAGRPLVTIPENIEYNRSLVAAWEERNRAIAAQNERTRRWAPLRVRIVSP